MNDVMIDIETLGNKPGCPVLSIGAVYFDRQGNIGDKFYACMGFNGLSVGIPDKDTLEWWSNQSPEAKAALLAGNEKPDYVAFALGKFIKEGSKVWGNGSIFDISILDKWFEMQGKKSPWDFWNVRDVRTMVDVFNIPYKDFKFEGVPHNALHDAIHQVKYMTSPFKVF